MIQAHIYYSGRVQGVGFRYTVQRIATSLGLQGWVRNLYDGRVELLVEGEKELITELLERIDTSFEGYVRDKQLTYSAPVGKYNSFNIAF